MGINKVTQIEYLVNSLPKGINTQIGENELSTRTKAKNYFSRAFYRKIKFLVLDEATSALDNKTESDIISSLESIQSSTKLTIVLIAHRLSTVKQCDCIYEFENGKIKNYGLYDDLIKNSETFREMTNSSNSDLNLT